MPTSGTFNYGPLVQELFDEAFERAGIDLVSIGTTHIAGGFRSLRTMLNSEWSTIGVREWQITQGVVHTVSVGETSFFLQDGELDIMQAVLRRQGSGVTPSDVEMYPITRQEYTLITNKLIQGRPDRYFVDRQPGLGNVNVFYWQAGSNNTDQIIYNSFHQNQDVVNALSNQLDLPDYAYEALCAGLAAKFALKWNFQRFAVLQEYYAGPAWAANPLNPGGVLGMLRSEDRERGDISTYPAFEPRVGRR